MHYEITEKGFRYLIPEKVIPEKWNKEGFGSKCLGKLERKME
jgi:hypothetical protein